MSLPKLSGKLLLYENFSFKLGDKNIGRSCSIHDFNKQSERHGEFNNVYLQARFYYDKFYEYLRMTQGVFDCLLNKLEVRLTKITINFREPASVWAILTNIFERRAGKEAGRFGGKSLPPCSMATHVTSCVFVLASTS